MGTTARCIERRHRAPAAVIAGLVAASVTAVMGPTPVDAGARCSVERLVTAPDGQVGFADVGISDDGRYVVFTSHADLSGDNPDLSREVFRADTATGDVLQVSDTLLPRGAFSPAIDGDGNRIAFVGQAPTESALTVWLWTARGPAVTAIRSIGGNDEASASGTSISDDGQTVGYLLTENMKVLGDVSAHVWRDGETTSVVEGRSIASMSVIGSGRSALVVSRQAGSVGFGASSIDLDTRVETVVDPPRDSSGSSFASSDTGRRVVSISDQSGTTEAWLHQPSVATHTRLTTNDPSSYGPSRVAINGRGTRVTIATDAYPVGAGHGGSSRIVLLDFGSSRHRTTILTDSGNSDLPAIDGAGTHIAFVSDHEDEGPDNDRDLFVATCAPPPAPVTCRGALATVALGRGEEATRRNDVIVGTREADVLRARGGDDVVCGRRGKDTLIGGAGDDVLDGGRRRDVCRGGRGTDVAVRCETTAGMP